MRLDVREAKFTGRLTAFTLITGFTGQGEIGCTVTASSGSGHDMVDLQREAACSAVRATALPLLQQVLAKLIALYGPLLILDTSDLWMLHLLAVKAVCFVARIEPVGQINVEIGSFYSQKTQHPESGRIQYQKGTIQG